MRGSQAPGYGFRPMACVEIRDLSLHYEEWGEGPAILLIAGIPAIANDWEPGR